MKKYARVTIAILIMAALGVGYYYYLSNRQPRQDATQQSLVNEQLAQLKTKNIEQNYPESVKEVVNLFMRISKMYYTSSVSDEDLGILASQARLLFDDELKSKQTDAEYLESLKQDIADYKKVNRYISDFKLEGSSNVKYKTLNGQKYTISGKAADWSILIQSLHCVKMRRDTGSSCTGNWQMNQTLMNKK